LALEVRIAFYMDEHVPSAVSQGLRLRGVDVLTAQDADMRGASDEDHFALAVHEKRTIFTQDADFLRLHASNHAHAGIVFAAQGTPPGAIVRSLVLIHEVLRPEEMAGRVEFV
jgi:predicted nuclease of predicted toxin-antitoxin system